MAADLAFRGPARRAPDHRVHRRRHNPSAADRIGTAIESVAARIPDHPLIHRPGRVPGTREAIVHPNYILVYRVRETIDILAVLHARQQYP